MSRSMSGSADYLVEMAAAHPCWSHKLFERLRTEPLSRSQARMLLTNYDAHAGLLRRLLLNAACVMPEAAVGFVLENVRNEYGNGSYAECHQGQLRELISLVDPDGESREGSVEVAVDASVVRKGVRGFMRDIVRYYRPHKHEIPRGLYKPAIVAGAITATEIMALEEFKAMQSAFRSFGLAEHRWFDHVMVESEHGDESLCLAEYFIDEKNARESVEFGMRGSLEANLHLYDGLLESVSERDFSLVS